MLHASPQILILAWPGVVINFLLIALCAKYFFPYGWTWPQALLFGAMLSATDPVAVVAVLHEVRGGLLPCLYVHWRWYRAVLRATAVLSAADLAAAVAGLREASAAAQFASPAGL